MESDPAGGLAENGTAAPPPFLSKTYDMVDDPATDAIVSWGAENNTFVVWNTPEFARDLLPKYFKHNNFSSFVRQLNTYGFRKVDPDKWEFANEGFLRGQKHLLKIIHRRKPSHVHGQMQQPQPQNTTGAACVEVGKFGLEEEIERLKRDKNVLMQELVRLRQQQQSSDHQVQTLGKRLQGMEQRQQQMMSFLAKAIRNPGFFAQFVQQNDSNRRIAAANNKKRRLPKQEGRHQDSAIAFPDGQIIKYQPLINEAGKSMLRQILKVNSSPRLESSSNSDSFLLENFVSTSETLDDTSAQHSRVNLAEVPSGSGAPYVTESSGFSTICSSSAASGIPSPAGLANNSLPKKLPGVGILTSVPEAIAAGPTGTSMPEFPELQNIMPEESVTNVQGESFIMRDLVSAYVHPIAMEVDETVPLETDVLFDEDQKLPGINDAFWEQFLAASPPLSGDTEELESSILESEEMQKRSESGWPTKNLENLTEQMGLLSSDWEG